MHKNIPNKNFKFSIQKITSLLKKGNISYWMGRGILKDFLINGDLKFQHGDLDFHILEKDKDILREYLIPILESEGYYSEDKDYKLAFRKPYKNPEFYVEFPYIFQDEDSPDFVYHIANGKKEICRKECFNDSKYNFVEVEGEKVRIPDNPKTYLEDIYGKYWKDEHLVEEVNLFKKFGFR